MFVGANVQPSAIKRIKALWVWGFEKVGFMLLLSYVELDLL